MGFSGTLAGFTNAGVAGFTRPGLTLDHETVTATDFIQSSGGFGDLVVSTQDQAAGGVAGRLDFHVTGNFASNAFAFTNNTTAQSATIYLASSGTT